KVLFLCTQCAGYQLSLRQASTHNPKCRLKRKSQPVPISGHRCGDCSRSFLTTRGLSLHRRRMQLNSYLRRPYLPQSNLQKVGRVSWSDADLQTLKNILDADPDINSCVKQAIVVMPVYSKRQIQYQCRTLQKKEANEKSMSTLAAEILDGRTDTQCTINSVEILNVHKGIWERADTFKSLGQFGTVTRADNSHFSYPILAPEAVSVIKKLDPESAPGPDGLKKRDILGWDPEGTKLARLINTLLVHGVVPKILKCSHTVLIPKRRDLEQLRNIKNWCPITISPILLRLFSGILTSRLMKACSIHPHQRGFIKAPGCTENLQLLKVSVAMVLIDFAKAFDTVSHSHIHAVLERRGVDELIRGIIKSTYRKCYSQIQIVDGPSNKIYLKVDVKQGDPMSLMLFSLARDPLIHKLDEVGKGFDLDNGTSILAIAYTDNLVLLSDSWEGMDLNLKIMDKFASLIGLAVNPAKCHSFLIQKGKPVIGYKPWELKGHPTHSVGPSESVQYLGIQINPWKDRISKAEIKPSMKTDLLHAYAIPRLFYTADFGMTSVTLLEECDSDIQTEVRKWLHLHPTTANGLLYPSYQDGGLSILRPRLHPSDDKISNCWLRDPVAAGFTQSEFILGLRIRSKSLPVRASVMSRTPKGAVSTCRVCRAENETFKHVMNCCEGLQSIRMSQHNNVCKFLGNLCRTHRWKVMTEKKLICKDGKVGCPDLIVFKDNKALIIDVTIPLESNNLSVLALAAKAKVDKYKKFKKAVTRQFPGITVVSV
uniref:Reverse transcriptase domain-containing protein n=1 Tax=Sphaeramia orbicularis TaxID=375764 RepID=A0A672ZCC9_9TELE